MSKNSQVTSLDSPNAADQAESTAVAAKVIVGKSSGHDASLSGKRTKVNIFASEQEHGNDAVLVGHNGVVYLIPRGMPHDLPDEVVGVLRDAVTDVTVPMASGGGVITRPVPRYNFQILS